MYTNKILHIDIYVCIICEIIVVFIKLIDGAVTIEYFYC